MSENCLWRKSGTDVVPQLLFSRVWYSWRIEFGSWDQPFAKCMFGYRTQLGKFMFGYWDHHVKSILDSWVHPMEKLFLGWGDKLV